MTTDTNTNEITPRISDDEIRQLQNLKIAVEMTKLAADRAIAESRVASLERKNYIQMLYIKYGLTDQHTITEANGVIARRDNNQ